MLFPLLLNFCYITVGNLGKVFWDLVINLILSFLLPYVFTEGWLFITWAEFICFSAITEPNRYSVIIKRTVRDDLECHFGVDLTSLIAPFISISRRIKIWKQRLCTAFLESVPSLLLHKHVDATLIPKRIWDFLSTLQGAFGTSQDSGFYTRNVCTLGRPTLQAALQRPYQLKLL